MTDVADLSKMKDDAKRLTLLASLIHVLRTGRGTRLRTCSASAWRSSIAKGDRPEDLREEHRAESERLLEVFGEVLAAAREASEPELPAGVEGAKSEEDGGRAVDVSGVGFPHGVACGEADEPAGGRRTGRLVRGRGGADRAGKCSWHWSPAAAWSSVVAAHQAVAAYHGNNYLPL